MEHTELSATIPGAEATSVPRGTAKSAAFTASRGTASQPPCFDGPHEGSYLPSLQRGHRLGATSFSTLSAAFVACMATDICGGITEVDPHVYSLRRRAGSWRAGLDSLMPAPADGECSQWILPQSWVRTRRTCEEEQSSSAPPVTSLTSEREGGRLLSSPFQSKLVGTGARRRGSLVDTAAQQQQQRQRWGVVLPFHGGSERLRIANASWHSLCRAMRAAQDLIEFHVLAIDDSGNSVARSKQEQPWLAERQDVCRANNLASLTLVEGKMSISENIRLGYAWASQFDYITNIDSDLLVIQPFFLNLARDYVAAQNHCTYAAISGYTSNIMGRAYGANFMFSAAAWAHWVKQCFEVDSTGRSPEHHGRAGAWDDEFGKALLYRSTMTTISSNNYLYRVIIGWNLSYDSDFVLNIEPDIKYTSACSSVPVRYLRCWNVKPQGGFTRLFVNVGPRDRPRTATRIICRAE